MWYEWADATRPCFFDRADTEANLLLLDELVPPALRKPFSSHRPVHAIRQHWTTRAPVSFLTLNALAADLKLLQRKPGVDGVLRDLFREDAYASARHTLQCAAIVERGRPGSVLRFVEATNTPGPDFVVAHERSEVPVECKMLATSQPQRYFNSMATTLRDQVMKSLDALHLNIGIVVILRPGTHRRTADAITRVLEEHRDALLQRPLRLRQPTFNLECAPLPTGAMFSEHRKVLVVSPVDAKEDYRAVERARKASSQLRAYGGATQSGILMVGLTGLQSGIAVKKHLAEKFGRGDLKGISGVALLKSELRMDNQYTPFSLVETFTNGNATSPLSTWPRLKTLGPAMWMREVEPKIAGVPVYWVGTVSGRIRQAGACASLYLPTLSRMPDDVLRWSDSTIS